MRLRARFSGHQEFDGHVLPTRIDVTAPGSKVTVTYRDLEANPDLDPASFQLVTPRGMKDLPLGPRVVTSVGP